MTLWTTCVRSVDSWTQHQLSPTWLKSLAGTAPLALVIESLLVESHELAAKSCIPCRGGIPPLSEKEARELHSGAPEWSLEENGTRLKRRFEFKDFKGAMEFVNRVADIAEAEGHHPDIAIHWNKVDLLLWTHKIGGLHENDFILAAKIDRLLEQPSRATGQLTG